jgi:hypothetical protein
MTRILVNMSLRLAQYQSDRINQIPIVMDPLINA